MLAATALVCPATVAALAAIAGLPADLALGAILAAAAPVAISAGVISRRFGFPDRPPVWAALGGLALGPLLLPAIAAAVQWWWGESGTDGSLATSLRTLAERATLFGVLPAAAAFALRSVAPDLVAKHASDLRGTAVLSLAVIGFCAGGTLTSTFVVVGAAGGAAVLALSGTAQVTAASAAWAMGRLAGAADRAPLGRPLLIVGVARNASFAWATAAGTLTTRGEAFLALAVVGTYVLPLALVATTALPQIFFQRSSQTRRHEMQGALSLSSPGDGERGRRAMEAE